jgi:Arc/MetJ-type ribon-helix-helix transcriptional regulator
MMTICNKFIQGVIMDSVQVNVNLTEDDVKMLDQMMQEDFIDNRSAYVRRLIRLEWARRHLITTNEAVMDKNLINHE